MLNTPSVTAWPKITGLFAGATREADLHHEHRKQLQWMLKNYVSGAWSPPSTFFQGWIPIQGAPATVHLAPYGARVLETDAGPLLYVPASNRQYRNIYRIFAAHYGFRGEVKKSHIDHVVPRRATKRWRKSSPDHTYLIVMAADSAVNQSWGQWESTTRESGLGYMPLLKGLGHPPPSTTHRSDQFSGWLDAAVREIIALDGSGRMQIPASRDPTDRKACALLGISPGATVSGEKWVRYVLLTQILEVRGLKAKRRRLSPPTV